METFYLGIPEPAWLPRVEVPVLASAGRLLRRVSLPVCAAPVALDSGAFSQLYAHGRWTISPYRYVELARACAAEWPNLAWCAPQDWPCEPAVLSRTRHSLRWHQDASLDSYLHLRSLAPDVPWLPVVQGWLPADYLRHVDHFSRFGFTLAHAPIVGVGSVCRRQSMNEAGVILSELAAAGLRLHGFGFKLSGIKRFGSLLTSADSQAWSVHARRQQRNLCTQCDRRDCRNCLTWALKWSDPLRR